jgi:type II secretory pathway component PulF
MALFFYLLFVVCLFYGGILYAYLRYRAARQDEVLFLLAGAAESGAPLAPALRAYLEDRSESGWREVWTILLQFFLLPGYYWFWHRQHSFNRKLARVARRLEEGVPLDRALRSEPAVASPTTALAVAVGESSGRLALSLRRSLDGHLSTVWLETMPRLLYPLGLLLFLDGVAYFWMLFLLPKMQRIAHDFGMQLPAMTQMLIDLGHSAEHHRWLIAQLIVVGLILAFCSVFNAEVRWYLPGLGRVYRMSVRSRVLKMLAVLLEAGKPVPEALTILANSGALPIPVAGRLHRARARVEQGEPLSVVLWEAGLLSRAMAPLVSSAERSRNLPWSLVELGNLLADQAQQRARRLSLVLFSVAVAAIGLLVGILVVGMFMPLVEFMRELA